MVYFLVIAIIAGFFRIFFQQKPPIESFLLALLVCMNGLQGVFAFYGHFFKSDEVAEKIGWPSGNPFQKEIAFTNLAMGVLGLMCIWFQGDFWLAAIIAHAVFVWGAGYIHILDLKKHKNIHIFNAGPVLYFDVLMPFLQLGLFVAYVLK